MTGVHFFRNSGDIYNKVAADSISVKVQTIFILCYKRLIRIVCMFTV